MILLGYQNYNNVSKILNSYINAYGTKMRIYRRSPDFDLFSDQKDAYKFVGSGKWLFYVSESKLVGPDAVLFPGEGGPYLSIIEKKYKATVGDVIKSFVLVSYDKKEEKLFELVSIEQKLANVVIYRTTFWKGKLIE